MPKGGFQWFYKLDLCSLLCTQRTLNCIKFITKSNEKNCQPMHVKVIINDTVFYWWMGANNWVANCTVLPFYFSFIKNVFKHLIANAFLWVSH